MATLLYRGEWVTVDDVTYKNIKVNFFAGRITKVEYKKQLNALMKQAKERDKIIDVDFSE